jgi:hypothetical protein
MSDCQARPNIEVADHDNYEVVPAESAPDSPVIQNILNLDPIADSRLSQSVFLSPHSAH